MNASTPTRQAQRGMTLVEALVAFGVASVGMLAAVAAQSNLRAQADLTRQRAEAVQLAEEALEQMRADPPPASVGSGTEPTSETRSETGLSTHTRYSVTRAWQVHRAPRHAEATATVRWTQQDGQATALTLHSVVSGAEPALSGRLLMPPANALQSAPLGRSIGVPLQAVDLGDGHSAWAPPGSTGTAWVFDNRSGLPTAVCTLEGTALSAQALAGCRPASARLVAGHVRFATGAPISIADAQAPPSAALPLQMALRLTEGDSAATQCFSSATSNTPGDVQYACLVAVDATSARWSGRLDVTPMGWTIGSDAASQRVCRYSADRDHDGRIANVEHPLDYVRVDGVLLQQNFLVVRGDQPCPAAVESPVNTVEQAPSPTATPIG